VGEIKSTLDLVMEKTRNLTLSAEEKQAQKQIDIGNRIKGLVQKFEDGLLTGSQLKTDYDTFKKDADLPDDSQLVKEILSRIDPGQDSQNLLEALEECCRFDTATIRAIINEYRAAYDRAAQKRAVQLQEDLAQNHSISGTAVLPNLDADEQWQQEAQDMRRQFQDHLSQAYEMAIDD
jgi:hypothetical protein